MNVERTFVMIKPDGFRRRLIGEIIGRLEKKGLTIVALRSMDISRFTAEEHYAEHRGKPFYAGLIEFITSGPAVAMVVEGEHAVAAVRHLMGATDPGQAAPGTVRGDLALTMAHNVMHGSDSLASAAREIALFFPGLSARPAQQG